MFLQTSQSTFQPNSTIRSWSDLQIRMRTVKQGGLQVFSLIFYSLITYTITNQNIWRRGEERMESLIHQQAYKDDRHSSFAFNYCTTGNSIFLKLSLNSHSLCLLCSNFATSSLPKLFVWSSSGRLLSHGTWAVSVYQCFFPRSASLEMLGLIQRRFFPAIQISP